MTPILKKKQDSQLAQSTIVAIALLLVLPSIAAGQSQKARTSENNNPFYNYSKVRLAHSAPRRKPAARTPLTDFSDVINSTVSSGTIFNNSSTSSNGGYFHLGTNYTDAYWGAASSTGGNPFSSSDVATGAIFFGDKDNVPLHFLTSSAVRMTIAGSGNVGIGTTSPSAYFHIANVSNASNPLTRFESTSGGAQLVIKEATAGKQWMLANGWNVNQDFELVEDIGSNFGSTASRLLVQHSTGNVGIGTTNPLARFHVKITTDENLWVRSANGLDLTAAKDDGSDFVKLNVNASPFIINAGSGGNVGIGTASPQGKLHIKAGTDKNIWLRDGGSSQKAQIISVADDNGTINTLSIDGSNLLLNSQSSGNVGIGTPSPTSGKLQVTTTGGGSVSGGGASLAYFQSSSYFGGISLGAPPSSNTFFEFLEGATKKAGLNWDASGSAFSIQSAADFNFQLPNGTGTLATIKASGNVGIGIPNPTSKLHVSGDGKFTGSLTVDGNITAKYQDVAEWVPASEQLSAGTVVVLDSTKSNQVTSSSVSYDTRVAGVISEQPGIALGEKSDGKVLVATTGRVRVKVDATKGPIQIGDLLVTSDVPGVAMKSNEINLGGFKIHRPGTLIGKALEPLEKGKGEILVLLSLQ
jgi:hypothetical protein